MQDMIKCKRFSISAKTPNGSVSCPVVWATSLSIARSWFELMYPEAFMVNVQTILDDDQAAYMVVHKSFEVQLVDCDNVPWYMAGVLARSGWDAVAIALSKHDGAQVLTVGEELW